MKRSENEVTRLLSRHSLIKSIRVTYLPNQNNVGVLTQYRAKGLLEVPRINANLSFIEYALMVR